MPASERNNLSDHDLLVTVAGDVGHIKEQIDQIIDGDIPSCAVEKKRMETAEQQIEKLWKTRASAISLNLLWGISVTLYGALIVYLISR
ncbi:MAG: hypothetical protein ABFD83_14755 [Armatimonadota bacterium]